ncbi:acyltransferase family protein [Cypionkella aquatica]|uniref:acyltransferase family protein n=1 Tax=Cypionkella aquatica TaxID=1756042 RepID=UPI0024E0C96E|nr:acyltransferase [Cypionkella aquatica]
MPSTLPADRAIAPPLRAPELRTPEPRTPDLRTSELRAPGLRALEGLRGYACVIVVLHHFALGFLPGLKANMSDGVVAYTFGWLLNGTAAVYVFFVLSGFVLTLKFYQTTDPRILLMAAVKRLPRLWPAAAYGVLLGYLALVLQLNGNGAAAAISGSDWLAQFAYSDQSHAPSLVRAAKESVRMFLKFRTLQFNTNLWTMVAEFYGSLLALCAAFVVGYLLTGRPVRPLRLVVGLLLALALVAINLAIPKQLGWSFTIGALIAYAYVRQRFLPKGAAIVCSILGLMLLGAPVVGQAMLGAALLVWGVTTPGASPRLLTGDFGQFLGRWSFPLYISHTIGILTLASFAYSQTAPYGPQIQLATSFAATWAFAIVFAYPVLRWEAWYLPRLNRGMQRIFTTKA